MLVMCSGEGVRVNVDNVLPMGPGPGSGPLFLFPFHCWRAVRCMSDYNINVRKAVPGRLRTSLHSPVSLLVDAVRTSRN